MVSVPARRAGAAAVVLLMLVLPTSVGQIAPSDDPAAVLESMAVRHHVPRNEGVQELAKPPADALGAVAPAPSEAGDTSDGAEAAKGTASAGPSTDPATGPDEAGMSADDADAAAPAGTLAPIAGPLGHLMAAVEGQRAAGIGAAMMDYYVAVGLAPSMAPPTRPSQYDENQTITYTYSLGDVDGDGIGDLMLDRYCPKNVVGCPSFSEPFDTGVARTTLTYCGQPHIVEVISGTDGRPLWNMTLDRLHPATVHPAYFCSVEFTVGTVPMGDGTYGLLTYAYEVIETAVFSRVEIIHTLRLYEMVAGNVEWEWSTRGIYGGWAFVGQGGYLADSLVLHPALDVRPADGPYLAPAGSQEALTIHGIGYTYLTANAGMIPPTWDHVPIIARDYQADEWAARLDPRTGQEAWRVETFTGDDARSVIPQSWWGASIAGNWFLADIYWDDAMIPRADGHYWGYRPCCHDLDGDGHADMVYTTIEFSNHPSTNHAGPYGYESRLVVFSGKDGSLLYEKWLAQEHDVFFVTTRVLALGDIDADGDAEFVLERMTLEPKPEYRWSIRSGSDGEEMWRIDNVRRMDMLVPGDVDGDGGNDLLLIEWFQHEYYGNIGTPYANVTHTPIKVFSGATGQLLWRRESFVAPADLDRMVDNGRINGFPDLDGDGVQDIPIMDPIYLPDGTIIHRTSFYSPVDDRKFATAVSAGAFAVPVRAGDVNGDGREDFTLLNGDLLDLWVTTYDGRTGEPVWSRRITDLRVSSAAVAVPLLRNHDIPVPEGNRVDIVVNFQMSLVTTGAYLVSTSNRQMVAGLVGHNGTLVWSTPRIYDSEATAAIPGASPASALFADLLRPRTLSEELSVWRPTPLGGGAAFLGAVLASFMISRRLIR